MSCNRLICNNCVHLIPGLAGGIVLINLRKDGIQESACQMNAFPWRGFL